LAADNVKEGQYDQSHVRVDFDDDEQEVELHQADGST
jgi:hypothetical protein